MIAYRRFRAFILLATLGIVSACSEPQLTQLAPQARVLAFGDSLTQGVGAAKGQDYPAALAALSGWEVVNAGISGETTSEGVKRFAGLLDDHSPELVILMEGGNDILRSHPPATTRTNLAQMILAAQARQIPLVLVGVPEKKLFSDSAPLYTELASEFSVPLQSDLLSDLLKNNRFKSDPIHLNAAGYREFATQLHRWLGELGAH